MFAKCCVSCLLIFTSSVCTLSVYLLFVTPSCSCLCSPLASENLFVGLVVLSNPPTPTSVISSWAACNLFSAQHLRIIHLLLYRHKVIGIGKHGICSLIVWSGRWVGCPIFSNSNQLFSLLSGSNGIWMPVKYQRVSEQEVGAKGPGSALALAESSIWGGESTPVDLDLKNPAEEWAWVASWSLNVKCWNVGRLLLVVVCVLWKSFKIWFRNYFVW